MHRRSSAFVIALLLAAALGPAGTSLATAQSGCGFPFASTDATATNVTVQAEPQEIVTLNPSAAQTMWEIGAKEKVVGISGFASYLDGAENRTNVYPTTSTSVNVEKVVNESPDLVLAPNTIPNATVDQLRTAGLTVYKFETATDTAFIVEKTRHTGRLVGECEGANDRADQFQDELDTISDATDGVDRPRVLYTFFGFTAGEDTFIDTIITTAGGTNVATEAGISGYKQYSEEIVVQRDPEWIMLNSDDPNVPDTAAFDGTTAVQEGNNVTVDANYVSQPAPRIIQPILTLVQALHPVAYQEAKQGVEQVRDSPPENVTPPDFSIASTTLNASRVELYGTEPVQATIANDGGPGTFEARLAINGSPKSIQYVSVPADGSATVRFEHTFSAIGHYDVRINDHAAGNVTVVWALENDTTAATATPTPTPTSTPTPTPTPTQTPEPTPTPEPQTDTATPVGSTTGPETPRTTPTASPPPTAASSGTQTGGQPGFGLSLSAISLLAAGWLAVRRS
mgnify:CR=1 FL=1